MLKKCQHCNKRAKTERKNRTTNKWVPLCDSMDCYRMETGQ